MITKILSILAVLSCVACMSASGQKHWVVLENRENKPATHLFKVTEDYLELREEIYEILDVPYAEYYLALNDFLDELICFLGLDFEKRRMVLNDPEEQFFIYLFRYFSDFEEAMKDFEKFVMDDPENKHKLIEDFLIDIHFQTMIVKKAALKLHSLNGNFRVKV